MEKQNGRQIWPPSCFFHLKTGQKNCPKNDHLNIGRFGIRWPTVHGTVKSFGHPTYGLQHLSTIDVNQLTINAQQFNNQLDLRSLTKRTNVRT
jgi:hypothetical protein